MDNWGMSIRFVEMYLASEGFSDYWERTGHLYITEF